MAGWVEAASAIMGLIGAGQASQAASEAARTAKQAQNFEMGQYMAYGEPFLEMALQAALASGDARNWALKMSMALMTGKNTIDVPETLNPNVPSYIAEYGKAQPGTWQYELYKWASYNPTNSERIRDMVSDVQGGGSDKLAGVIHRMKREGWAEPPADYQPPAVSTGGTTETLDIPSWMQPLMNPDQPFTSAEYNAMMYPGYADISNTARRGAAEVTSQLSGRGMATPTRTSGMEVGARTLLKGQLTRAYGQQKANVTIAGISRKDMLRQAAMDTAFKLYGLGTTVPNSSLDLTSILNTNTATAQNNANTASQNAAQAWSDVGSYLAYNSNALAGLFARRKSKTNQSNSGGSAGTYNSGGTYVPQ